MPVVKLSNNADYRTVNGTSGSSGNGGILYNYNFVKSIYVGGTSEGLRRLIYEDSDAPVKVSEADTYKFMSESSLYKTLANSTGKIYTATSTEANPISVNGEKIGPFNRKYYRTHTVDYKRDSEGLEFSTSYILGTDPEWIGTMTLDNVEQSYEALNDSTDTLGAYYTIGTNDKPLGACHTITMTTRDNSYHSTIYEYQASSKYAFFGCPDVTQYIDMESAASTGTWTKNTSGSFVYSNGSTTEFKTLTIRPIQNSTLNVIAPGGYIYIPTDSPKNTAADLRESCIQAVEDWGGGQQILPTVDILTNLITMDDSPFYALTSDSQDFELTAGTPVLIGFLDSGQLNFMEKFKVTPTAVTIGSKSNSGIVQIDTTDTMSWTAAISDSYFTINKTSGTGSDTITISCSDADSNSHTGSIGIYASDGRQFVIYITREAATGDLAFSTISSGSDAPSLSTETTIAGKKVVKYDWTYVNSDSSSSGTSVYYVKFVPSVNGTVQIETYGDQESEDTTYSWGAIISNTNTWNTSICTPASFTAPTTEGSAGDTTDAISVTAGSTYYVVVRTQDNVRDNSIHANPDEVSTVTIVYTPKSA
jgi:hypothetical protein